MSNLPPTFISSHFSVELSSYFCCTMFCLSSKGSHLTYKFLFRRTFLLFLISLYFHRTFVILSSYSHRTSIVLSSYFCHTFIVLSSYFHRTFIVPFSAFACRNPTYVIRSSGWLTVILSSYVVPFSYFHTPITSIFSSYFPPMLYLPPIFTLL